MKNTIKKLNAKLGATMGRYIPVVLAVLLVVHTNSTASAFNGQPEVPEGLKKYRKF